MPKLPPIIIEARMTANLPDDLMNALTTELDSLKEESAGRLCHILRGLFACMQDLNARLAALEIQHPEAGGEEGA